MAKNPPKTSAVGQTTADEADEANAAKAPDDGPARPKRTIVGNLDKPARLQTPVDDGQSGGSSREVDVIYDNGLAVEDSIDDSMDVDVDQGQAREDDPTETPASNHDDHTPSNDHHHIAAAQFHQHEHRRRTAAESALAAAHAREKDLRTRLHALEVHAHALEAQVHALDAQVHTLDAHADRHRRGHERVLADLHRFHAAHGVPATMPDDYLVQRARALRQDVRDFALQFYEGDEGDARREEPPTTTTTATLYPLLRALGPPVFSLLASPARRPAAVQAFLWLVLARTVFHRWCWAGAEAGRRALVDVCALLGGREAYAVVPAVTTAEHQSTTTTPDPNADRRFYTWRATTARLVAERASSTVSPALVDSLAGEICAVLDPWRVDDDHHHHADDHADADDDHTQELKRLLHAAIAFDRDTAQQAARLEWLLPRVPEEEATVDAIAVVPFDPALMERDPSEAAGGGGVLLAVAPGLRKWGRSNGEGYGVETVLLKMEVACEGGE